MSTDYQNQFWSNINIIYYNKGFYYKVSEKYILDYHNNSSLSTVNIHNSILFIIIRIVNSIILMTKMIFNVIKNIAYLFLKARWFIIWNFI